MTSSARALVILLCALLAVVLLLFVNKHAVEYLAERATDALAIKLEQSSRSKDEFLIEATAVVHQALLRHRPDASQPLLMRARAYLTHRFVPAPLRITNGAIDVIYLDQDCDNAARTLTYLLHHSGFDARQFNIITPSYSHSIVRVNGGDGSEMLLDPAFGLAPRFKGELLGAKEIRTRMREGAQADQIWHRLNEKSHLHGLYAEFGEAWFAVQGEKLEMVFDVRIDDGKTVKLGTRDGSGEDLKDDAARMKISPNWYYLGNRHDRGWVRGLRFHQQTRVIIGTVKPPRQSFITSAQKPRILNQELIYEIANGEQLRFVDGEAGYDWLSLRSYQETDYMRFEPITAPD